MVETGVELELFTLVSDAVHELSEICNFRVLFDAWESNFSELNRDFGLFNDHCKPIVSRIGLSYLIELPGVVVQVVSEFLVVPVNIVDL